MILPKKHLSMSASLIGLGGVLLEIISKQPKAIDECWSILNKKYIDKKIINQKHTFDNMILAIDLLYMLGAVTYENEKLKRGE